MIDFSKLPSEPEGPTDNLINQFDAPIPGESLTVAPRTMPYETPPQFADVEEALDAVFSRVMQPRTAAQLLNLLEAGLPVAFLVESLLVSGMQEGLWSHSMTYLMAPALSVILIRMAQAARIEFNMDSQSLAPQKLPQMALKLAETRVSSGQVDKAVSVAEKSRNELATDGGKVRLLSPLGG